VDREGVYRAVTLRDGRCCGVERKGRAVLILGAGVVAAG